MWDSNPHANNGTAPLTQRVYQFHQSPIDDCIGNFTLDHTKDSPVKYNFIFDKPWNRSVQEDNTKNFRVHGWDEIYELIDKLEDF